MELTEQISQWVDAHEADIIKDIAGLVAIDSQKGLPVGNKPFGMGPAKALNRAMQICQNKGFIVKNYNYYVATADLNDKKTMVDVLGHLDIVDPGSEYDWDSEPFQLVRKEDGCIYGRGVDDDKGPVVLAIYAMQCLKELGVALKYNARLIMGTDEESGSADLEYYYSKRPSAPYTFTPDSGFPIYNTEKGSYKPICGKRWKTKASQRVIKAINGGIRINVVPDEATAVITLPKGVIENAAAKAADFGVEVEIDENRDGVSYELTVIGKTAHASTPQDGVNAITALMQLLGELPLEGEEKETIQSIIQLFPHNDHKGEALGIAMEDALSGDLTLALTLLEWNEDGVAFQFDSRVPLKATERNCKRVVEKKLKEHGFTLKGDMQPPHHTPEESPFIQTLLKAYETYTGEPGACLSTGGGTYVHNIEGGVAFGASMPGFKSNLHAANERMNVKDGLTACKIFAKAIADLCM